MYDILNVLYSLRFFQLNYILHFTILKFEESTKEWLLIETTVHLNVVLKFFLKYN